jgi:F-box protein 9
LGNYKSAIELYRQAIKLDSEVEYKYRKWVQKMPVRNIPVVEYATDINTPTAEKSSHFIPLEDQCPILDLPREILSLIIAHCIYPRIDKVSLLMVICKSFYRVFLSDFVWRHLCLHTHDTYSILDLEKLLPQYQNSWKRMWIEKPRIRRDGVYISKCSYKRTGWSDTLTYLQPIHIVTYYRYLRLLKNSNFLFLTTPKEPIDTVSIFQPNAKIKEILYGSWSWESSDVIRLEWQQPNRPSVLFSASLKVLSVPEIAGKFSRLKWSNIY